MSNPYKGSGPDCTSSLAEPTDAPYTGHVMLFGPPAGDPAMVAPADPCPSCPPDECCATDGGGDHDGGGGDRDRGRNRGGRGIGPAGWFGR